MHLLHLALLAVLAVLALFATAARAAGDVLIDGTSFYNTAGLEIANDGSMAEWTIAGGGIQFRPRADGSSYLYTTVYCRDYSRFSGVRLTVTAPAGAAFTVTLQNAGAQCQDIRGPRYDVKTAEYVRFTGSGAPQSVFLGFGLFGLLDPARVSAVVLSQFSNAGERFVLHRVEFDTGTGPTRVCPTFRDAMAWDPFSSLASWTDASQAGGGPANYFSTGRALTFTVNPTTEVRPKLRYTPRRFLGPGRHQWRVYTPRRAPGTTASIGAFLYFDDYHELDFEIGYGAADTRRALGARDHQLLAYVTTQAVDGRSWGTLSGTQVVIDGNAWHDLALDLDLDVTGTRFVVSWWIDGRRVFRSAQAWGPAAVSGNGFAALVSLENLWWMGLKQGQTGYPGPPTYDPRAPRVSATFDTYQFTPNTQCLPLSAPLPLPGDATAAAVVEPYVPSGEMRKCNGAVAVCTKRVADVVFPGARGVGTDTVACRVPDPNRLGVADLLTRGVRWLDLAVCTSPTGLVICSAGEAGTAYGASLAQVVVELASWTRANPTELVVVYLSRADDAAGAVRAIAAGIGGAMYRGFGIENEVVGALLDRGVRVVVAAKRRVAAGVADVQTFSAIDVSPTTLAPSASAIAAACQQSGRIILGAYGVLPLDTSRVPALRGKAPCNAQLQDTVSAGDWLAAVPAGCKVQAVVKGFADVSQGMFEGVEGLVERILVHVVQIDPRGADPLALLSVAPGLLRLKRAILDCSLHPRTWKFLRGRADEPNRDALAEDRWAALTAGNPRATTRHLARLCADGRYDCLDRWLLAGRAFPPSPLFVDLASAHDQILVLRWLAQRGLAGQYTWSAIDDEARARALDALDWWIRPNDRPALPAADVRTIRATLMRAVERDDAAVLSRLLKLDLEHWRGDDNERYNYRLAEAAVDGRRVQILRAMFWHLPDANITAKSVYWIHEACDAVDRENVAFLDWMYRDVPENRLDMFSELDPSDKEYGVGAIQAADDAGDYGYDLAADAFLAKEEEYADDEYAVCAGAGLAAERFWAFMTGYASKRNKVSVLKWLRKTIPRDEFVCPLGWSVVETGDDEDAALERLEWWGKSGVELKVGRNHVQCAREFADKCGFSKIATWWADKKKWAVAP
ncbi:hypothetical protein H9P43_009112 [Blastocladiella emersonii ATCC 22665]|nr:hypothetical protein H9P43_009112 [Blastocladiella emersonii ATCC 22665]